MTEKDLGRPLLPRAPRRSRAPSDLDGYARVVATAPPFLAEITSLRNWVNAYRAAHAGEEPPLTISERARLRELEKENRELKLEREFLGKAAAFFASEYR